MGMDLLAKYNIKPAKFLKAAGIGLVAVIVVALAVQLVGSSFSTLGNVLENSRLSDKAVEGMEYGTYTGLGGSGIDTGLGYAGAPTLSQRNIAPGPIPPVDSYVTGTDAEEYEVKDYNATIETRDLEQTCAAVIALKARPDVIFESANETDDSCSYVFKAEQAKAAEVLAVINDLQPKDLSENTQTIKRQIEDFTNQEEILRRKLTTIEDTLGTAINAYDELTSLATQTRDVESLTKIIDSKLNMIERLTQERINVVEQLDYLSRAKAEQLDRLDYTYFYVTAYESKYIDGEQLRDSWKAAVQEFVHDANRIVQRTTVGLVALLLFIAQYLLYAFIILAIAKYAWRFAKGIWRK